MASSLLRVSLVSYQSQRLCDPGLEVGLEVGSDTNSQRDLEQDPSSSVPAEVGRSELCFLRVWEMDFLVPSSALWALKPLKWGHHSPLPILSLIHKPSIITFLFRSPLGFPPPSEKSSGASTKAPATAALGDLEVAALPDPYSPPLAHISLISAKSLLKG